MTQKISEVETVAEVLAGLDRAQYRLVVDGRPQRHTSTRKAAEQDAAMYHALGRQVEVVEVES